MKHLKLHIPATWRPFFIIALINLTSLALLISAWQFYQQHAHATGNLQHQLKTLQAQQQAWHHNQALLHEHLPHYQKLLESGFISQAQPKLWLQQLKQLQQTQQLFPIEYTMHAQQPYPSAFQSVPLMAHSMRFEMDLLHEGDLLDLLDNLKNSHVGSFILRRCKLHALQFAEQETPQLKPHLHAQCELDWVTISPLNAPHDSP